MPQPGDPQSLNRYSYAANNSLRYTDPNGHISCEDVDLCGMPGVPDQSETADLWLLPAWDAQYLMDSTDERRARAEAAYWHFMANPGYFVQLFALGNEGALQNSQWIDLDRFAQYSTLHTSAESLVLSAVAQSYGLEGSEQLQAVQSTNWKVWATGSLPGFLALNGTKMTTGEAIDAADAFLGPNHTTADPTGRYVSSDGLRQVRMLEDDLAVEGNHAGGPHINLEVYRPVPGKPGRMRLLNNIHIFITDKLR